MTESKTTSYTKQYYQLFMGLIAVLLGSLMVTHAILWEAFGFWFPFTMVIFALLIVPTGGFGTILGLLMLLGGCSIFLHQLDIVTFPYLKEILGWFFIAIGVLLIFIGSLNVWRKWKGRDIGDDPYGDPGVDY